LMIFPPTNQFTRNRDQITTKKSLAKTSEYHPKSS